MNRPPPRYIVPMFPYPSGRLHVGHVRNYAIADAVARHYRRQGETVVFPIGWDAFGLPAENAAREHGADPREWTERHIAVMRDQMKALDFSFDWPLERATCEPDFVHRGQRLFLELWRQGWIERRPGTVWWDPVDETVLANEQVVDGRGWRSGAPVEQRRMSMLFAKTSAIAHELDAGLTGVDWPAAARNPQKAWIGWDDAPGSSRLHDWCLSRQRSWGTPVPLATCARCGEVAARTQDLPWMPLATRPSAAERACTCSGCGGVAERSSETLDTFWDSSFYFLVYPDPQPMGADPLSKTGMRPVDVYIGGLEHATMHLLYARWMMRALRAAGYPTPEEPFRKLIGQGMVCGPAFREGEEGVGPWVAADTVHREGTRWVGPDGKSVYCVGAQKMSKSKKNGVDPQALVERFGADAVRWSVLFAGPYAQDMTWEAGTVETARKHLDRLTAIARVVGQAPESGEDASLRQRAEALSGKIAHAYETGHGVHALLGEALGLLRTTRQAAVSGAGTAARVALDAVLDAIGPVCPRACAQAAQLAGRPGPVRPVKRAAGQATSEGRATTVPVHVDGRRRGEVATNEGDTAEAVWERFAQSYPDVAAAHAPEAPTAFVWKPGVFFNAVTAKPKPTAKPRV